MPTAREILEAGSPRYPEFEPRETHAERHRVYEEETERFEALKDEIAAARVRARECRPPLEVWKVEPADPRLEAWRSETWKSIRRMLAPVLDRLDSIRDDASKVTTAALLDILEKLGTAESAMERMADAPV